MNTGVSRQLWDINANNIKTTGPTDLKLTFSERKFKELSENVNFYLLWCIGAELCHCLLKGVATPQHWVSSQ